MNLSLVAILISAVLYSVSMAAPAPPEKRGLKSCYKHAKLTQYVYTS